jgi:hypothetical protein
MLILPFFFNFFSFFSYFYDFFQGFSNKNFQKFITKFNQAAYFNEAKLSYVESMKKLSRMVSSDESMRQKNKDFVLREIEFAILLLN